jgi:hypothetical protein
MENRSKAITFAAILAILACICIAGCAENTGLSDNVPVQTEDPGASIAPSATDAVNIRVYPEAMALEERYRYDAATGRNYALSSSKNTISVYIEDTLLKDNYYIKNHQNIGDIVLCEPRSGYKFLLVTPHIVPLTTSAVLSSPPTWAFTLIADGVEYAPRMNICDSLGVELITGINHYLHNLAVSNDYPLQDIGILYVQRKLNGGDDFYKESGWIIYEVPQSFKTNNAYLVLDLGQTQPVWWLADLNVNVLVTKDRIHREVVAQFQGGSNYQSVRDITVKATLSDGTVVQDTLHPIVNEEVRLPGTSGDDHVTVTVNSYSGEKYVIFNDVVKNR